MFEREIQFESGSGGWITLHRAQSPAIVLALERQIEGATPEAAQLGIGVLEDVLGDLLQEAAGKQHFAAGEMCVFGGAQFALQAFGERLDGDAILTDTRIRYIVPI